jgi:UPF0755 protein
MVRGDTILHKLTIPEGLSVKQIEALMAKADGLEGEFPAGVAEGSVMPDTYFYSRGESRREKIVKMQQAMREYTNALWEKRQPDLPLASLQEAIILASIVEKETGVAEERGRIAAVFVNRLRKGMKLQTDPTVIYAATDGRYDLGRPLLRSDLQTPHPYNTYMIDGLPPGPIANPSRASIEAVLNPPASDELFFVSTGNGAHRFASTLEGHNQNVRLLREVQHQRQTDAIAEKMREEEEKLGTTKKLNGSYADQPSEEELGSIAPASGEGE